MIIKPLSITDKKDGKKNFPLMFKTELKTDDSPTNIKKGNVIGKILIARSYWLLLDKNPGANIEMTWWLKTEIKMDKKAVIKKNMINMHQIKSFESFGFSFSWLTYIGMKTLFTAPSAKILLNRLGKR